MSNWDFLNQHRVFYQGTYGEGWYGKFAFALPGEARRIVCISSDGSIQDPARPVLPRWRHVSVSFGINHATPSWAIMCQVKDLFWDLEDVVMQLHPAKSQWISHHPGCLHLWQPLEATIPLPPRIFV